MEEVEIIALLVKFRKEKFTQEEMAVKLDISLTQYSKYEKLHSKMKIEMFLKILSILNLDLNSFFSINSNITKDEVKSINEKLNEVIDIINSKS